MLLALITGHTIPNHVGATGHVRKAKTEAAHDLVGQKSQCLFRFFRERHHGTNSGAVLTGIAGPEGIGVERQCRLELSSPLNLSEVTFAALGHPFETSFLARSRGFA
jgi:hypothetical protein